MAATGERCGAGGWVSLKHKDVCVCVCIHLCVHWEKQNGGRTTRAVGVVAHACEGMRKETPSAIPVRLPP